MNVANSCQNKSRAIETDSSKTSELQEEHNLAIQEKDEEIEVYKSGMEQALMELEELRMVCHLWMPKLGYWFWGLLFFLTYTEPRRHGHCIGYPDRSCAAWVCFQDQ